MRRIDLRNSLAPVAPARDRVDECLTGTSVGHLHGWHVPGQSAPAAADFAAVASPEGLRPVGNWNRGIGCRHFVCGAVAFRVLHRVRGAGAFGSAASWRVGGALFVAADHMHGSNASGDSALD